MPSFSVAPSNATSVVYLWHQAAMRAMIVAIFGPFFDQSGFSAELAAVLFDRTARPCNLAGLTALWRFKIKAHADTSAIKMPANAGKVIICMLFIAFYLPLYSSI